MKHFLFLFIFNVLTLNQGLGADLYNVRSYDFDAKRFTYPIVSKGIHLARIEKDLLLTNMLPSLDCFRRLSSTSIFKDVGYSQMASTLYFRGFLNGSEVVYFVKMDSTPTVKYFKTWDKNIENQVVIKNGYMNFFFKKSKEKEYVVSFIPPKEFFAEFKDKKSVNSEDLSMNNTDFLKSLGFWLVYKAQNLAEEYKWDDEEFTKDKQFLIQDHVLKEIKSCQLLSTNLGSRFKKDLDKAIEQLKDELLSKTPKKPVNKKKRSSNEI